jgi:hypothetical protein
MKNVKLSETAGGLSYSFGNDIPYSTKFAVVKYEKRLSAAN